MKIDISKWQEYIVNDIFVCETTKYIDKINAIYGNTPYVTRSAYNNGIDSYIEYEQETNKGNCITIGAEGRFAFYQERDFHAGVKVYTLRNEYLNKLNALFICAILNKNVNTYQYNEARILDKIKKETLLLPCKDNQPDWEYMENYIKEIETKANYKIEKMLQIIKMENGKWKMENGKKQH